MHWPQTGLPSSHLTFLERQVLSRRIRTVREHLQLGKGNPHQQPVLDLGGKRALGGILGPVAGWPLRLELAEED
jgi:hypothetical protein